MEKFSSDFTEIKKALAEKLVAANFVINAFQQEQLLHYLFLLHKWNRIYNLTSVRDPKDMVTQHILDSLAITPYLQGDRILDVGSGGGLPGIPLALTQPERNFVLIDSNGKKTRFLHHVVQSLGITNVQVEQARVEAFTTTACFTTIMARAFSSLIDFLQKTQHLCCADGCFLAMKGAYPTGELIALHDGFTLSAVHVLEIPGLVAQRHLVCIKRSSL